MAKTARGAGFDSPFGMSAANKASSHSELTGASITVNILGAVERPGVFKVEKFTDVISLIAIAGGLKADADQAGAFIRRRNRRDDLVIPVEIGKMLSDPKVQALMLEADDVVIVPRLKPAVSPDTVTLLSVIASILSILLSGIIITKNTH